MRDELRGRFDAAYHRSQKRDHCPTCGEHLCPSRMRKGYGCVVCNSTRPNDFRVQAVVWREAIAARQRGLTARQWFNRLTEQAKVHLLRELVARQQVASAGMGRITPTVRWLERGLKPGQL